MEPEPRLWHHNGQWRIQDCHQLPDRHGVVHDVWASRCENGRVMFFETEDQARTYLQESKVEREDQS